MADQGVDIFGRGCTIHFMNRFVSVWLLFMVLVWGVGCDPVQQRRQEAYADIEGITLEDLQARQPPQVETLLSFSVLTYVLDAESIESLETIVDSLSQGDIRYTNVEAFEANGFSAGIGLHKEGASIAQKLQSIGAVRVGQGALKIPPNSNEILSSETVVGPRAILYSTSSTGIGGITVESGKVGWVISAGQGPDAAETVHLALCPAYWQIGASNLRLLTGRSPFEFRFFEAGRIDFELAAGQFCILGPQRVVTDQDTLDRILFEMARRKQVRFFVIIYGGPRGSDDD